MIRKDVIIAILTTFCLCALMFSVIPINSQLPYDPWADINDDGKINMWDIGYTAQRFGAVGDSTKNVNVTNWRSDYELQRGTINFSSGGGWTNPTIFCGGYSRLSILLVMRNANIGAASNLTIYLGYVLWSEKGVSTQSIESLGTNIFNITVFSDRSSDVPKSYLTETKGPYCDLIFYPYQILQIDWWVTIDYTVYLRNE